MRGIGIGTAVVALALSASAATAGQARPQSPPPQSASGSPGQAAPSSQGQPRPGSTGQAGSHDTSAQHKTAQPGKQTAHAFVNEMTIVNLAEVQLGNSASEKTLNADVRAFGQMMARDHTRANSELTQIASQLHIQPPTQMDQKHRQMWSKLSELNGGDFDREYMNAMVMGHEEVLAKLRARADASASSAQSSGSGDHSAASSQAGKGATKSQGEEALNQWAAKMIPAVQMHLDKAKEVQQKLGK